MAFTGKKRVVADYALKVGFDSFKILSINPNKEELDALNSRDNKAPVYTGVYTDSVTGKEYSKVNISIYLQGKSTTVQPMTFTIINRERFNKDGSKKQWINNIGNTVWAKDVAHIKAMSLDETSKETTRDFYKKFLSSPQRPALMGEDKLFEFIQKFTQVDTQDPATELTMDFKKLFKGNFKEIQELYTGDFAENEVCTCFTIKTVKNEGDDAEDKPFKTYQSIYSKVLDGSAIKHFTKTAGAIKQPKYIESYLAEMQGENGCKEYFIIGPVQDYNAALNPAVTPQKPKKVDSFGDTVTEDNTSDAPDTNEDVKDDLPF